MQLERAVVIDETVYGPDNPKVGRSLSNLGHVLRNIGDYSGAKAADGNGDGTQIVDMGVDELFWHPSIYLPLVLRNH